jgi:heme ABC exporter ATP-binding subunit CcmA
MTDTLFAIRVRQLSKGFGRRRVLGQLDLEVAAGESVVFRGANGAGKTTLLRCLAGLLRPDHGDVQWFGNPAGNPEARRLLGMLAHESRLYPHLSLRENLVFAARMCDVAEPGQRADQWLEAVGLHRHADHTPPALSQGMRQRLAVARALVHDPQILLLDEPFSGLDTEATAWLFRLLEELRSRGRTLLFVLHDEEKTRRLADRVLHLREGRLWQLAAAEDAAADQTGLGKGDSPIFVATTLRAVPESGQFPARAA